VPHKLEVYCSVNNCHYWQQGNRCDANQILITSDSMADQAPDSVDAPKAATIEPTPTSDCLSTCCKTFVPSGSGKEHQDGVYRA